MHLDATHDAEGVTLDLVPEARSLLARLSRRPAKIDLDHLPESEKRLLFALADLRALGEARAGEVDIGTHRIRISHRAVAALDQETAEVLGLPPLVDLTLATEAEGIVGSPDFRLRHEWRRGGRRETVRRQGAILDTARGLRRLPLWMVQAIEVAENFDAGAPDADPWAALADFRQALEPGVETRKDAGGRLALSDFLRGLKVRTADRFALSPFNTAEGLDFETVPFRGDRLPEEPPGEEEAELSGAELAAFQKRVRVQGARGAYRVGDGSFLVVDQSARPVLETMAAMHRAPAGERASFVRNPRPRLAQALEARLRADPAWAMMSDAGREEALESGLAAGFVETREYSARVTGIGSWQPPALDLVHGSGTTWLPEAFGDAVAKAIQSMTGPELDALHGRIETAMDDGVPSIPIGEEIVAATPALLAAVEGERKARARSPAETEVAGPSDAGISGPVVLVTADNIDTVTWKPDRGPRRSSVLTALPPSVRTPLKAHQVASFDWAVAAWSAGLPGILNADEQGLGKTLQTIAFLVWLKSHTAQAQAEARGPVLVVAPTSLLRNWEEEVERHVESPGLGHLVRLYGSATGAAKRTGRTGFDTRTGEEILDLDWLHEALRDGRAHRHWILTTYTTLTNYQHSLARIPFAALVMDEIQALKNPGSLRAAAARAVQADFRIGLTGTPIENDTIDLWAVMDQIASGALGSLREFRQSYGAPDEANMSALHARVFTGQGDLPPLGLRRLKDQAARDLPTKSRKLHPRVMPTVQAAAYEKAREGLAKGGRGAALKMLHHIRGVSVHPSPDAAEDGFITASARLSAAFDILRGIQKHGERALVFVESLKMQYRFVELARRDFGLARVEVINGGTPIEKRQEIVNRFQRHLHRDGGFDLLVLGPKAAGTGLTLTAATHVIHLSRWWNPAVEEQCNDRVHRLGQTRPITVHLPLAIHPAYRDGSFDCLLHGLMQRKRRLAKAALWPMGDTEGDADTLRQATQGAVEQPLNGDPVEMAMQALFARDGAASSKREADGSYFYP